MSKYHVEPDLLITFWPSIQEIQESVNLYAGGLKDFYDSLEVLHNAFIRKWYEAPKETRKDLPRFSKYTDIGLIRGQHGHGYGPPEIAEWILYLGTSGGALIIYKLLRLRVESRNGRKIRIKTNDIEIEVTQMSPSQFAKLHEQLIEQQNTALMINKKELRKKLLKEGFILIDENDSAKEKANLLFEVNESIKRANS